jgi:hypothetical protein
MVPTLLEVGFFGFFLAGFVVVGILQLCVEKACEFYTLYVFALLKFFLNFVSTIWLIGELTGSHCYSSCGESLEMTSIFKAFTGVGVAELGIDVILVIATCIFCRGD